LRRDRAGLTQGISPALSSRPYWAGSVEADEALAGYCDTIEVVPPVLGGLR